MSTYGGTWSLAGGRLACVLATYMMVVGVALVGVAVLVVTTA
jgi:hypothetical protein